MGIRRGSKATRALVVGRNSNAADEDASRVSVLQHSAIFSSLALFRPAEWLIGLRCAFFVRTALTPSAFRGHPLTVASTVLLGSNGSSETG